MRLCNNDPQQAKEAIKDFSLPPLMPQPIVGNAVRHGVLKREYGGTVTIHTGETKTEYFIIVEDDGVGMELVNESEGHFHIGIENVCGRLKALCDGTLELQSKAEAGTCATITLPKEEIILCDILPWTMNHLR